jgi:hypothetical protein
LLRHGILLSGNGGNLSVPMPNEIDREATEKVRLNDANNDNPTSRIVQNFTSLVKSPELMLGNRARCRGWAENVADACLLGYKIRLAVLLVVRLQLPMSKDARWPIFMNHW